MKFTLELQIEKSVHTLGVDCAGRRRYLDRVSETTKVSRI